MTIFDKWFKIQFGSLPNVKKLEELEEQIMRYEYELNKKKACFRELKLLQEKYTVALHTAKAAPDFKF